MMTWIFNFAFSAAIGPISCASSLLRPFPAPCMCPPLTVPHIPLPPGAYPVEILNTSIRAKGCVPLLSLRRVARRADADPPPPASRSTALTSSSAWISNFMIAQVTPKAFAAIGWRYYMASFVWPWSA